MSLAPAEKMQNVRDKRKKAGLCVICVRHKARKAQLTGESCSERGKRTRSRIT